MRGTLFCLICIGLLAGCASTPEKTANSEALTRGIASTNRKKVVQVHSQSCRTAYKNGFKSPSVASVSDAADVCQKAAEAACTAYVEKNSDGPGTGDGRYVAASCELSAAYGANKAVHNGRASSKCEAAYKAASNAPSTGDVESASVTCSTEKAAGCEQKVNSESDGPQTGDGSWVAASCELTAAYGSYVEVSKRK